MFELKRRSPLSRKLLLKKSSRNWVSSSSWFMFDKPMKYCSSCFKFKTTTVFVKTGNGNKCLVCKNKKHSTYRSRDRALGKKRKRIISINERMQQLESYDEFRIWCNSLKDGKACIECKKSYHFSCLDWDHRYGYKLISVANLMAKSRDKELILKETEKCELMCANCHRIKSFSFYNKKKYPLVSMMERTDMSISKIKSLIQ